MTMNHISIFTLTSKLHDEQSVAAVTKEFLGNLHIEYTLHGGDYTDYGSAPLNLIYVRTGGTEDIFLKLLPELRTKSRQPFYFLTSGKSNSLAASMEILSYLRQNGLQGEIIHGSNEYIRERIAQLSKRGEARRWLHECRLGVIGKPSDWLISSHVAYDTIQEKLGVTLIDIPMQELLDTLATTPMPENGEAVADKAVSDAMPGAERIYAALKNIIVKYHLQGFTIRCFDLLTSVRNTGCLALAKLNSEGFIAGCEGDIPALLSMTIARAVTGTAAFQANPASIRPDTGEMVFAHCTIPFCLVERYEFDTHFESGIGVGIRGYMKEGPVTIFKVAGDLSRHFIEEAELIANESKPDLCRTQQVIRLKHPERTAYFLNQPIGNHHIIMPGHHREQLEQLLG